MLLKNLSVTVLKFILVMINLKDLMKIMYSFENYITKQKKKLKKYFKTQPETKSCFTSIEKYSYECFCSSCKRTFKILFLEKLFRIEK